MIHNLPSDVEMLCDGGATIYRVSTPGREPFMSEAARDEADDRVGDSLDRRLAALRPAADQLRAALLRGESPESLGLTEEGLAQVLKERGIA